MCIKQGTYNNITGIVFSIIAVLHILRLVYSWDAQIGTFAVPIWLSWVALIASGFLAYSAFKLANK